VRRAHRCATSRRSEGGRPSLTAPSPAANRPRTGENTTADGLAFRAVLGNKTRGTQPDVDRLAEILNQLIAEQQRTNARLEYSCNLLQRTNSLFEYMCNLLYFGEHRMPPPH
jgi:hypothetical protein